MAIDLTQLRYFQAIASCGSLTAAARTLGVSQPTLTVALRNLEESLSTTLFLRERTGVKLTATGEELQRHAVEIFSLLERAEEGVRGLEDGDVGHFVIGCHESLGAYFLPKVMGDFLDGAPRIELTIWNGSSASVLRAVLDHHVHFGIVVNPSLHPDLVVVPLFSDAVDLFVAADVELSPKSKRLRQSDLRAARASRSRSEADEILRTGPLLFAGRVHQCQVIIDRIAEAGLLPKRLLPCGDFELVKSLALAGVGVALLPGRVAAYGQEGKLRRLHADLPSFADTIALVYRSDIHRTRAAMRVKDALVAHGKDLGRDAG